MTETYPYSPGWKRTDTSKAAAEEVKPKTSYLITSVLGCLKIHGELTADECARLIGEDKLSIRPRFSELRELGKIKDTGKRRRNKSGRSAIVWSV